MAALPVSPEAVRMTISCQSLVFSRSGHEIRQDGTGHILEGDGLAMEELQIVHPLPS